MSIQASSRGEWITHEICYTLGKMLFSASFATAVPMPIPFHSGAAFAVTALGVGTFARTIIDVVLFDYVSVDHVTKNQYMIFEKMAADAIGIAVASVVFSRLGIRLEWQ